MVSMFSGMIPALSDVGLMVLTWYFSGLEPTEPPESACKRAGWLNVVLIG